MTAQTIVLASSSAVRRKVLENAGIEFDVHPSSVDEDEIKGRRSDLSPDALARELADAKALDVSSVFPDRLVIGADQVLDLNGVRIDKPADRAAAANHLRTLRGNTHRLHAAVSLARNGVVIWRHRETATLTMRPFSDGFLDGYISAIGDAALAGAGAYQFEGLGAQLFERIEGDYFTVLGLPLLPLLAQLRDRGALAL